jgi:hypothetical protein
MKSIVVTTGAFAHSKHAAKTARTGALLVLGLALSGCSVGMPGYQEFVEGHYQAAHTDFAADYKDHPDSSIAQMNMAVSYRQRGERDKANVMFHDAADSGRGVHPDGMSERHDSSTTVSEVACRYLAEDRQSDPNCPI